MASSNQNVIYDNARYLKRTFKIRNKTNQEISYGTSFCFQSLVRWDLFHIMTMYPYIRYPSVNFIHSVDIYVL